MAKLPFDKKVLVEGSPERAADRGMGYDLVELREGATDFLNSPEVAETVVRQFLGAITDVRKAYNSNRIDGDTAQGTIATLARHYAGIFSGDVPGYHVLPWNTDGGLAAHLAQALGGDATPENAIYSLFLRMASELITQVLVPFEQEEMRDEIVQFRLDVMIEDAVHLLLGLPQYSHELGE